MEYCPLGRTGIIVSHLTVGAMMFGAASVRRASTTVASVSLSRLAHSSAAAAPWHDSGPAGLSGSAADSDGDTIRDVTPSIEQALTTDRTIDITTTGRTTGDPRRIEIWFHRVDGRYYITGTPGARSWYANLVAHPDFTFHLKESTQADLAAVATPVEGAEKTRVLRAIEASVGSGRLRLDDERSPLVEVALTGAA